MKARFEYKGHTVLIEKSLFGKIKFKIDGETHEIKSGFFANLKDSYYEGEILGGRDKGDKVRIEIKTGVITDTVTFIYNGNKIDSQEIL